MWQKCLRFEWGDYGAECCWARGTVNIRVDLREQIKFGAATRKLRGENTGWNEFWLCSP